MSLGGKFVSKGVQGLLLVAGIVLVAGGAYFLTKSVPSPDAASAEPTALAAAVLTLKQDIVALKSREAGVAARTWPTYQAGLEAELSGDREFARENFEAARQAYLDAIFNFKKALEAPQGASPEKPAAEPSPSVKAVTNDSDEEDVIRAQARKVYAKVLSEERSRQSREEKAAPPPTVATTPTVNTENDVIAGLRNQAVAAKASMTAAKSKLTAEGRSETLFQEAEKIEIRAQVAFAENNYEQSGRLYKLAEEQYQGLTQQIARAQQREKEWGEIARREVRRLIGGYEAAFARRSVSGLKALFESGFSTDDEKAWAKFFASVQDLEISVSSENVQINGDAVEAGFMVRINYANHKGIKQTPLTFHERWTVAEKNGKWTIVSRQVR